MSKKDVILPIPIEKKLWDRVADIAWKQRESPSKLFRNKLHGFVPSPKTKKETVYRSLYVSKSDREVFDKLAKEYKLKNTELIRDILKKIVEDFEG